MTGQQLGIAGVGAHPAEKPSRQLKRLPVDLFGVLPDGPCEHVSARGNVCGQPAWWDGVHAQNLCHEHANEAA